MKLISHLIFSFILWHKFCNGQVVLDSYCSNNSNYTTNSTYETNLNLLLSSFSSDPSSCFDNTSQGADPARVYGLFLCRGDVTPDTCRNCVSKATQEVKQKCPSSRNATTWYDKCMLRYSNSRFFSKVDVSVKRFKPNAENATDPSRYDGVVRGLMSDIVTEAVNSTAEKRWFATGEANFTETERIYALVQCTDDLSASDCRTCLRKIIANISDCCSGKKGGRVLGMSCNLRFEMYPFVEEDSTVAQGPAPPRPGLATNTTNLTASTETDGTSKASSRIIIAIVVPVSIGMFLSIFIVYVCLRRRKNKKALIPNGSSHHFGEMESLQFDLSTIKAATNKFSDENKLGQGGFGAVYKGELSRGNEVAVKRLFRSSRQGLEEFKNEVVLVAKLQHKNLVRLLGCCLEGEEQILIFEYIPNQSLDKFLFDQKNCAQLNWERRYKIIIGVARGLLYLHEDSRLKIIHRDLKASNILLDGEMNPKISDFGTARLFEIGQTQGNTSRVTGTYGYMSPEYAMHGKFSIKSDVFSFGVLLLEIVTGMKNCGFHQSELAEDLPSYAWRHWKEGTTMELIDCTLGGNYCVEEVLRCIHMGLLCVQEKVADRPTMSSVIYMLNKDSITLPPPFPPVFSEANKDSITLTSDHDSITGESEESSNELLSSPKNEFTTIEL